MPVVALAFAALAGLLLWMTIGSHGHWWLKLGAIVLVPSLSFALWHALNSFRGWPTSAKPPVRAVYVASIVVEPESDERGAIYLWLRPERNSQGLFSDRVRSGEPRAYRLAYSRPLHEQLEQAARAVKQGAVVEFTAHSKRRRTAGAKVPHSAFRFYVLPPPRPPRKGTAPAYP